MDSPASRQTLEALLADSPFQKLLGLRLEAFDSAAQTVSLRLIYGPNVERSSGTGQYHGGVVASLIDIAGDFVRPAVGADLIAQARVRRAGRTIGVVDIDVLDTSGRLIALGRGCYGTQPG